MKHKSMFAIMVGLIIICYHFMGVAYASPPKGNATWLYDYTYPNGPAGKSNPAPGMWVQDLTDYNKGAATSSKLSTIFSYGGDVEMYCRGAGESSPSTPCNQSNVFAYYNLDSQHSTAKNGKIPDVKNVMPIVDGRLDGEYLKGFNANPDNVGAIVADEISTEYCADPNVSGVQVDLEPFDISQPGQLALFSQLAKNFTSKACVDTAHPNGRYFSFFAFSGNVKSDAQWQTIASTLGTNGFFVDSGYDLGTKAGVAESPAEYRVSLTKELTTIKSKADTYHFYYMVGIPAAASTMEFEGTQDYLGPVTPSGYQQVDYMKAAIAVVDELNLRSDPYFLGMSLWGWSQYMTYPPHSIHLDWPNQPTPDVLSYLQGNL